MTPPHIRFELVRKSTILQMTEHSFSWISNKIYRDIFLEWAVDDNNDYFNHHKNLLAIEALCTKRNIKFINIDSSMLSTDSLARDLMHPGIESHQKVANHILSLI